jgi:hypothetical protein
MKNRPKKNVTPVYNTARPSTIHAFRVSRSSSQATPALGQGLAHGQAILCGQVQQ